MKISRSRTPLAALAVLMAVAAILIFSAITSAGVKVIRYVDTDVDANDTAGTWFANGDPCTINGVEYEFCYDDLQNGSDGAIDEAKDTGETVLVGPGKYETHIHIDVENLEVTSRDGAGATLIDGTGEDPGQETVQIEADGVTFGPQPGTDYGGFTVIGDTNNDTMRIDGSAVGPDSVVVDGNVFQGADDFTTYGIFVDASSAPPAITGGHLVISNNTFEMGAGATTRSFDYGIYFDSFDFSSISLSPYDTLSLHTADVDLLSNTMVSIDDTGIFFEDNIYNSDVTINPSVLNGTDGSSYGIYFGGETEVFSTLEISGTKIGNFATGIYFNDDIEDSTDFSILDNNINDFTLQGIYTSDWWGDVEGVIDGNTLTGDPTGANYCMYFSYPPNWYATGVVSNNECSNFTDAGLYADDTVENWGQFEISDNVFTAHSGGADYGIYLYGSPACDFNGQIDVLSNTITRYGPDSGDAGIYAGDVQHGCTMNVNDNTITAHVDGAGYGIYVKKVKDESTLTIDPNEITGFGGTGSTEYGIYIHEVKGMATVDIDGNILTAHPDGADYGIYVSEDVENNATFVANENEVTGFDDAGIHFDDEVETSDVSITGNTLTAHNAGAEYGIYFRKELKGGTLNIGGAGGAGAPAAANVVSGFDYAGLYFGDEFGAGQQATVDGNTFTAHPGGSTYGMYLGTIKGGAEATFSDNTFAGFGNETGIGSTTYGAYISYVGENGILYFNNNSLKPHALGSCYGYYNSGGVEAGSFAFVNDNIINGIRDHADKCDDASAGMYIYDTWSGSQQEVCRNAITPHDKVPDPLGGPNLIQPGWDGINFNYPPGEGSMLNVCDNDVSGFTNSQLWFENAGYDGSRLDIGMNSFDGGDYGIWFGDSLYDGYTANIIDNSITGFDIDGVHFAGELYGKRLNISGNDLLGAGTNAAINFADDPAISGGAIALVTQNCMGNATFGVLVGGDITDTSFLFVNVNDFSGAPTKDPVLRGIDASAVSTNEVDGENNWWGSTDEPGTGSSVDVAGDVDYEPWLLVQGGAGCIEPPTPTPTETDTPTPTDTPVPPTDTPVPPTDTPTPTPTETKACGDVNDDGSVTAVDASLILQLKAGLISSLVNEDSADVNEDGDISSVDAALILQAVAGLTTLSC